MHWARIVLLYIHKSRKRLEIFLYASYPLGLQPRLTPNFLMVILSAQSLECWDLQCSLSPTPTPDLSALPFSFSTPFPSPNKTPRVSSVCMTCLSLTSLGPPCLHSAKFPLALYHNSPLSHGWAQHTLSFLGGNGGDYWATGGEGGSAGGSQVLCCIQGIWYSADLQS